MIKIEKLSANWDRENKERIDNNFAELSKLDLKIMDDFLHADPSNLTPKVNGLERSHEGVLRTLNDYGTNFTATTNGVIHRGWVYVVKDGEMGFGLAEQERNEEATSINKYIIVNLKSGWNQVTLNFPVEQNKSYTLFKRNESDSVSVRNSHVYGWTTFPFQENGLVFNAGKYLNSHLTYVNYSPFYDIELITSPAQIYKIANESIKPPQQFYVGDNPPEDAQFWFKPVTLDEQV